MMPLTVVLVHFLIVVVGNAQRDAHVVGADEDGVDLEGPPRMASRLSTAAWLSMPMMQMLLRLRASRYSRLASLGKSPDSSASSAAAPLRGRNLAALTTSRTWSTVSQ